MTDTPLASSPQGTAPATQARSKSPYGALAAHIQKLDAGDRAALARLDPDAPRPHQLAALARALLVAGLEPENWRPQTWPKWALIAHGMALAGHDGSTRLGSQLARARIAEPRVTRLLVARGDAFRQQLPRILRLLASHGVQPNWFELGELTLKESSDQPGDAERAEQLRLRIAGAYFAAAAAHEPSPS